MHNGGDEARSERAASTGGELAAHIAAVTAAGVPLAEGLRAAAEESDQQHLQAALSTLADQLEQGVSLEDAVTNLSPRLPAYLSGLILAAARIGTPGDALMDLIALQQASREVRRVILDALWYPLVVLTSALVLLLSIGMFVARSFGALYTEFQLKLPLTTELVLWWGKYGLWILLVTVVATGALGLLIRGAAGRAGWQQLLDTMPVLGPVWRASGLAQWLGLLGLLLRYGLTLPEALRLAGHGALNAAIGETSLRLADGAARGRPLSQMVMTQPGLPTTLVPLVQWGEQSESLRDAFQLGQAMYEERARVRAESIQAVVPPLLFIGIGGLVLFVVAGLFLPLVDLIRQLS